MAVSQVLHQLLVLNNVVRAELKGYAKATWIATCAWLIYLETLYLEGGDVGEKVDVGGLDVLRNLWWRRQEDG